MREKLDYETDGLGYSDATCTNLLEKGHKTFSRFSFLFAIHQVFLQTYLENQHFWKDGY